MNHSINSTFELRLFKTSKDKDFITALKIYSRNIPASIRTSTNEITYWLDNYNKLHLDKKLFLFGLYFDGILVGFSEMVFLRNIRVYVIDYLVIEQSYRKNNIFSAFALNIERFIENEPEQYDYVLTEIGFMNNSKEPEMESKAMIRLLKMGGLDVIKAPYIQPFLGNDNYDSNMNGQLMIWANNTPHSITKTTYMAFVHAIYFEHYLGWYKGMMTEEELKKYDSHLHELYRKINKEIGNKVIYINGYHADSDAKRTIPIQEDGPSREHIKIIAGLMAVTLIVTVALFACMKFLHISLIDVIPIFLLSLLAIFAFAAVYSKGAMKVFNKLSELFKLFSRSTK